MATVDLAAMDACLKRMFPIPECWTCNDRRRVSYDPWGICTAPCPDCSDHSKSENTE